MQQLSDVFPWSNAGVYRMSKPRPRDNGQAFPAWSLEAVYSATGYGEYPFLAGDDGPLGRQSRLSISSSGGRIHTTWNAVVNAEKLEHGMCNLTCINAGVQWHQRRNSCGLRTSSPTLRSFGRPTQRTAVRGLQLYLFGWQWGFDELHLRPRRNQRERVTNVHVWWVSSVPA